MVDTDEDVQFMDKSRELLEFSHSLNIPIEEIIEDTAAEFIPKFREVVNKDDIYAIKITQDLATRVCNRIIDYITDNRIDTDEEALVRYSTIACQLTTGYVLGLTPLSGEPSYKNIYELLAEFKRM